MILATNQVAFVFFKDLIKGLGLRLHLSQLRGYIFGWYIHPRYKWLFLLVAITSRLKWGAGGTI